MMQKEREVNMRRLLSALSDNDSYAFSHFYDIYYKTVFKIAYYFVRDKELCREVVSNVFVAIWQSRAKMAQIEKIEAYLYVVTKNEAHRLLKVRAKTQTSPLSMDELKVSISDPTSHADNNLIYREIEDLLFEIIDELPAKCRIIFLMNREEGLSTHEIATRLALSENTVRVQMKIAIDKIIVRIKQSYPDLLFSTFIALVTTPL